MNTTADTMPTTDTLAEAQRDYDKALDDYRHHAQRTLDAAQATLDARRNLNALASRAGRLSFDGGVPAPDVPELRQLEVDSLIKALQPIREKTHKGNQPRDAFSQAWRHAEQATRQERRDREARQR